MQTGVIPLYSLTQDRKKYKFNQPPHLEDFDEIVQWYIERLSRENVIDDVLFLLETGLPLKNVVNLIVRSVVMEGIHIIEQGFLVKPVIFEYLKGIADDAGIDYQEEFSTKAEDDEKSLMKAAALAKKAMKGRKKDAGVEMVLRGAEAMAEEGPMEEEPMPEEAAPEEEQQMELDLGMAEEKPAGLMSRG